MTLDIRLPMGILFSLLGLMLLTYGFAHGLSSMRAGLNVNAAWGAVLIVFGISMLLLARRHAARLRRRAG